MIKKAIYRLLHSLGLFTWASQLQRNWINRKKSKAFRRFGLETLELAHKATQELNSYMFLTFGTLLGAYREKGFIPFDNDLDVGMYQRPGDLPLVLARYGFQLKQQAYKKESGVITEESYEYKGVQIDFFYYFKQENDLFCYVFRPHESKMRDEANRTNGFPCVKSFVPDTTFELKPFLGLELLVPKKAKEWLTDIYGESFMTPIKNWSASDGYVTRIIPQTERLYRRFF